METKSKRSSVLKALALSGMCSVAYLAVYIARDTLGASTPQMTQSGAFSVAQVGMLSSVFFIAYAIGQLVNGILGDKIKSKYMIGLGLILGSLAFWLIPSLEGRPYAAYISYGVSGFCLAMIYAPMTKVVAENVEPIHATRCSVAYNMAALLGSPVAGLLAASLVWDHVFYTSAGLLLIMGVAVFAVFTLFEHKSMIRYNQFKPTEKGTGNIKVLLQRGIVQFTAVAILTGVIRTAVIFWLPTYINQHLGFDASTSALLYTVATLGISLSTLIAVALYEMLKRNMSLTLLISFVLSAGGFLLAYLISNPVINVICMVAAIIGANCASNMLWTQYCPSLYDTGMVSSATGFLDFCSYMAASVASAVFANAVDAIGWGWLILIWFGLMLIGVVISLLLKGRKELAK